MEVIELFAPNDCPIIGALAADGSVREFTYSYDRSSKVRLYVLADGTEMSSVPISLVDADGKHWDSGDVEWYNLFERRV